MFEELERLTGTLFDRYRIERELGRGGMATVYLATDLKHDRTVAIKILKPALAYLLGAERFLREIRVTAALQHPHILQLYDSGEVEGLLYYVMPYVPGESLRTRLERERQLPVDESVTLISTVAGALDYAHRQGLVHRDIKPENILLLDGQPILADFGIAVVLASSSSDRLTETGFSVGTVQYMSPEQAAGDRAVQPQSDIYSLGAVAYEMLAGEPPFTGPTTEAIRARVMLQPPDAIRTIRPAVPEGVEAAVLKALSKVPADRFRTASEFAAALVAPGAVGAPRKWTRQLRSYAPGALALTLLAVALVLAGREIVERPLASPAQRRQLTFSGNARQAAISPDGRLVAFTISTGGSHLLLVQDVAGGEPDTIGTFGWVNTLEWSPNGDRLLAGLPAGKAAVVPRTGGSVRTLDVGRAPCQVRSHWLPGGLRVSLHCASDQRILLLDLETNDSVSIPLPAQFTWLNEGAWSPDGRHFALATESINPVGWTLVTIAMDGRVETVVEDSIPLATPNWAHDGRSVYYARGDAEIWRIPMEPRTGRRRGAPEQLHRQLEALSTVTPGVGLGGTALGGQFSVTRDGLRMAYASGRRYANLWLVEATDSLQPPRIDSLTSGTALRWWPVVSPDGNWIAFAQASGDAVELFRMPIVGGRSSQITHGARVWPGTQIAWSPEGDRIAFISVRAGRANTWIATVDGGRLQSFPQTNVGTARGHLAWAPGALIAYQTPDHDNIALLDPSSGAQRFLVADTAPGFLFSPRFSPDGHRLAASWFRGGDDAGIWVFDLHDSSQAKVAPVQFHPRGWSSDSRYIFGGSPSIYMIDAKEVGPRRRLLTNPFRDAQCTSAGPLRPNAFVCAAFEFASDVWIIENFDLRDP